MSLSGLSRMVPMGDVISGYRDARLRVNEFSEDARGGLGKPGEAAHRRAVQRSPVPVANVSFSLAARHRLLDLHRRAFTFDEGRGHWRVHMARYDLEISQTSPREPAPNRCLRKTFFQQVAASTTAASLSLLQVSSSQRKEFEFGEAIIILGEQVCPGYVTCYSHLVRSTGAVQAVHEYRENHSSPYRTGAWGSR
ncbi:hypothetical protein CDD80_4477 [Ophiocordyceps camponoti-rufipedis]|uniref:Uncharacterized protein n=1 Tax=Ophiocordyceps camponoti-rufipedis TaxID=2004952 RepID=A0A2C5YSL5_9HYPO|nr:hypothetical protein CDD80_4477 [Ophiocordyceps camponoti-rufipedis]